MESETKNLVRELWQAFWEGGITDTLRVVEQISYLIFMKRIEVLDNANQERAEATNEKFESIFSKLDENGKNYDDCKWSEWKFDSGEEMLTHVKDRVFPFIKNLHDGEDTLFAQTMSDASFQIEKPSLLQTAIDIINKLDISHNRPDIQGDIFEELLSELQQSGKNGQFRTPRHIISMMTQIINPKIGEKICDPAFGTGGFLIGAYEHIVKQNTSAKLLKEQGPIGEKLGDKWNLLREETFYGHDIDRTMLRIGAFNMILHGIKHPNISRIDGLSKQFDQTSKYQVVMANPPFKGTIDKDSLNNKFTISTKKTELLFLELFYNLLENGGRAAIVVPAGVLFGSSNGHLDTRKLLLEKCSLDAIVYLPSGVFSPYSNVSTAILFFTKGGSTENVWLYAMEHDGYSLDDKRKKIKEDDTTDILEKFSKREKSKKSISITIDEIKENDYNLSVRLYIDNSVPEEQINIQDVASKLDNLKKECKKSEEQMIKDLTELGFKV
jgi:type I restriction enzyme M protein